MGQLLFPRLPTCSLRPRVNVGPAIDSAHCQPRYRLRECFIPYGPVANRRSGPPQPLCNFLAPHEFACMQNTMHGGFGLCAVAFHKLPVSYMYWSAPSICISASSRSHSPQPASAKASSSSSKSMCQATLLVLLVLLRLALPCARLAQVKSACLRPVEDTSACAHEAKNDVVGACEFFRARGSSRLLARRPFLFASSTPRLKPPLEATALAVVAVVFVRRFKQGNLSGNLSWNTCHRDYQRARSAASGNPANCDNRRWAG